MNSKFENSFPLFFRAFRDETIDTQQIELWSIFAYRMNISLFLIIHSKTNMKYEKKLSICLQSSLRQIHWCITMSILNWIDFVMHCQRPFEWYKSYDTPIKAENWLATRETIYLSCYTRGRHYQLESVLISTNAPPPPPRLLTQRHYYKKSVAYSKNNSKIGKKLLIIVSWACRIEYIDI